MPHESFLTTSYTTKIRNAIAKNMSANIELGKAKLSKMIQLGGFLSNKLGNFGKKVITDLSISLAKDNLTSKICCFF